MSSQKIQTPGTAKVPSHPRWGGRQKRTAAQAVSAEQLGIDPLEYLLQLVASEFMDEFEIGPDGKPKKVKVPVPQTLKVDICRTVLPHFYPGLNAQQVTGPNDGPVQSVSFDINKLLQDPAAVEAAQRLALLMAVQDAPPALPPGPVVEAQPQPARDPMDTLQKQPNGHWR